MRFKIVTITILIMIFFVSCKANSDEPSQSSVNMEDQSISEEDTKTDIQENTVIEEEIASILPGGDLLFDQVEAEIHTVIIDEPYHSVELRAEILGLETYTTLETEKYTDTATAGKEYVVVYLKIENNSAQDDYFNYNDLQSFVDEEALKTTFLLNNPKDYLPIFTVLPIEVETKGYLVYEVPIDWEVLKLEYSGWEISKGIKLDFVISANDLREVEVFGSEFYAPYSKSDD